jgi:oligoendopeptidase F
MPEPLPNEIDFSALPTYQPRRFVPEGVDLTDKDVVVELLTQLLQREIASADDLEHWLLDRSELEAAVDQAGSILYIRMTCQTDDAARSEAYKAFVQNVAPAIKPLGHRLNIKYLADRQRFPFDSARYEVFDRAVRASVEIFRDENVPIETDLAMLSQEYQAICGAMTVEFDGEERTLPQMAKYLQETDRPLRERAWRAITDRRLADTDKLELLFDRMLQLRGQVATNADFPSYREYRFAALHRFDYTPEDCIRYHAAVQQCVVPIWREIQLRRRETMGLDALRPWDTSVDPEGLEPLKPFEQAHELVAGIRQAFTGTDPDLGAQFAMMDDAGLLDLASRKGKAPGGYQSTLSEARKPFIFMNAVGLDRDVRTLLHEGGHAFHALAAADEPLVDYRHAPMEFCEVASMSMELLAGDHLSVFYDEADLRRSKREHLEDIIMILPWVATIDAFQHWLYTHPGHAPSDRRAAWLDISDRFSGGVVDWSGLDAAKAFAWHRQLHIFQVPFYYIEYGIAQLGALQLWVRAKTDPSAALAGYRKALALGGSRPLPELFDTAGLKFDFSLDTIAPLMDAVGEALRAI